MAVATAHTVCLRGAVGHLIDVQTDVSKGSVGTTIVGRPDASLSESRDRCRMAVSNSGFEWPSTRRITILLSPADLLKSGTHFDLAIAVSVLAASSKLPTDSLKHTVFVGELTLAGDLRAVPGVLPMVLAAAERGIERVVVPEPQAREAAMVTGMSVFGVRSLAQAVAVLCGEQVPEAAPVAPLSGSRILCWRGQQQREQADLADLVGMADARFALEVAAAGSHHLLLTGPKGAGKTSIAERIPSILPDLSRAESIELTAIHSLAGTLQPEQGMLTRPPFSAPHHDASKVAIIGGGRGRVTPGEISRAHCGVLFLDEFPLFRSDVIEALRQPLESGEISVARSDETVTLPARGMVVLACNPCKCGEYSADPENRCTCRDLQRRDYRARITGPLADRIDITRELMPLGAAQRPIPGEVNESSAAVRARVEMARLRQAERYEGTGWRVNGDAPGPVLSEHFPMSPWAQARVDDEVYAGRLSRRGATRVHRVAWTIADLSGESRPDRHEVEIALQLRTGAPLQVHDLTRRAG